MDRAGEYALAMFYAYILSRLLEYTPYTNFGLLNTETCQTDWFILTCFAFLVYFFYLRNAYNYWAHFDFMYAQNRRGDLIGLEKFNLFYLCFNAVCLYWQPMPFLQVIMYFSMPIAIRLITTSKS